LKPEAADVILLLPSNLLIKVDSNSPIIHFLCQRKKLTTMSIKKIVRLLTVLLIFPFALSAQVTTGTLSGVIKNSKGEPLPGATVTAVHTPTGSKYTTVAKNGGQYTLPNLRVGGPYTLTISNIGYSHQELTDQYVTLGALTIDGILKPSSQELSTVVVTSVGKNAIISSQRNGASTNISARQMQALPTINRSVQDFARLTPQAKTGQSGNDGGSSTGISFAGQSNRYNQFSIDGANASDAFGLSSGGTNGGNANINPISIESIQEIQIVLSPYDVTQGGFTGGGINAITKSGTNKFHGSVYGNYQNEGFVGKSTPYNKNIAKATYGDFKNQTFGASLGGPIVKNKLFFFISAESYEKATPIGFDPTQAGSGSKVNVDTLKAIKDFMMTKYGFDLGSYGAITNKNESTSAFGRIDWNISSKHKLTLRHSYVEGSTDIRSRSATSAIFENTGYKIADKTNSSVLELNSSFNSKASNVLRITYNNIRDKRIVSQVPNIFISNYNPAQATNISYNLGSDFSSAANTLDQSIFSITDNFTLYKDAHTLTFGTSNEFFKSDNVFLQGFYGAYTYSLGGTTTSNINNFFTNTGMTQYQIGFGSAGRGDRAIATLKAAQLSAYAQDVWATSGNFKLTYGLRVDLPEITTKPVENAAFNTAFAAYDVKTNQMPKKRLMFSPRVGFNWNVEGTGDLQIRGGLGLFTGRIPFVWISNQMSNTAVLTKNLTFNAAQITTNGIKFAFDKS
jgi:outer membrane receptor protein involved in Fe transport